MKITIGLALASGLFLTVAGCAMTGAGRAAPSGAAAASSGGGNVASAGGEIRNFNLEVKCPGVHFLKTHGKSDMDIEEQLQVEPEDIAKCEAWAAAQPKGYVPPPPPGVSASAGANKIAPPPPAKQ